MVLKVRFTELFEFLVINQIFVQSAAIQPVCLAIHWHLAFLQKRSPSFMEIQYCHSFQHAGKGITEWMKNEE